MREVLDISESFVEGFDFISSKHIYNFSYEEEMLTNTKSMEQRIKEITKYYLSMLIIGRDKDTEKKLKKSINAFKKGLVKINDYKYESPDIIKARYIVGKLWNIEDNYIKNSNNLALPMMINTTSENIGITLNKLAIYHSKKQ